MHGQSTAGRTRSTFNLPFRWAFHWAKVRSKYRLKSKSKVILLSESPSPNFVTSDLVIRSVKVLDQNYGLRADCKIAAQISTQFSATQDLSLHSTSFHCKKILCCQVESTYFSGWFEWPTQKQGQRRCKHYAKRKFVSDRLLPLLLLLPFKNLHAPVQLK